MLGLRLRKGIGPEIAARPAVARALDWARGHELVEDGEGGRIRLSLRGRLLSNEVFSRIA